MNEHNTVAQLSQWRKEFLIGSLIGLCVMLLALLAVVVSPKPRAALAQDSPRVAVSIGDSSMNQGDKTWVHVAFHNMPRDPNDNNAFGVYFRYYLDRNSDNTWVNADNCAENLVGSDLYITTWYRSPWAHEAPDFTIKKDCQVGNYRLRVSAKEKSTHSEVVSGTREISVSLGPSVTIAMPSTTPYYRGTALNPTISFHNLVQGADYTYEAYLMARNPANLADICEGTGLERNKTFDLNGASGNPVQKSVTISDQCPTNEYTIHAKVYDSDDRERGSQSVDFEITTDPNASPSVSVSLSESSPIAPGTEFDVTFNFYDIQPGTKTQYRDTMTNTSTSQAVGENDCGGSTVGWGQEVQSTVNHNPYTNIITIPSDCPAGAYRIVSEIEDLQGNDIISGSVDFIIGDPDLTPSAPSVSNMTAKQNSPFSQQLPVGTGGDGTLDYAATGLPLGLVFTKSTRTIAGTPTGTGPSTVRYTVTDSDGDSNFVEFTITVNPDLTPSPPSVSPLTATQNAPFSHQLPEGSGGDGTLSYGATGLPDGLLFTEATRTIAGTPTRHGSFKVTYTVTDSDGDSASVELTFTVNPDLSPTAPSISSLSARTGSLFTRQLPEGSGGDAPLSYDATNLPTGLTLITTTRTITGTPTTEQTLTVTYKVRDSDGDEATTTFLFTIAADLMPTFSTISGYTGRVDSPFNQELPAATGGDSPLSYTATNLPAGLNFVTSTRTIQGTPSTQETKTVTYTVRDDDGDEASTTFDITVAADLKPTLTSISRNTGRVGSPFSQVLPAAASGDTPLSYTATNLPGGLNFITSTRTIQGTPTTQETKTVTYTVRDEDGDEASTTFDITVEADQKPTLSTISGYAVRVNSPFSEVLPVAAGGDAPLSYTATNLPTGLSFITTTRTITGTPTAVETKTVTYTVRDEDGDEANTTFGITVAADLMPTLSSISGYTGRVDSPFNQELPAATGGDSPLSYTATNLPAGLNFITSTRTIQGSPSTQETKTVTYTVRDDDGDEASTTFDITVAADLKPTLTSISGFTGRVGSPFSQVLPAAASGDTPLSYTATNLPSGLNFITSTRTIQGTPTTQETKTVTYTVRDEDGDEASTTFDITVEADQKPTLSTISGYAVRVNSPFSEVLPVAARGDAPLSYTATNLPTGLSFITTTRTITGTPTAVETKTVTYTVRDEDGDEANTTFGITVAADLMPTLPAISGYAVRVNSPFSQVLPAATGGDPPLSYTATDLPTGLSFITTTRTISGTPTNVESPTVTYKVRDSDGDEDSTTIAFTVATDLTPSLPAISGFTAIANSPFSQVLPEATGGDQPLSYTATGLPTGLSFITSTRTITGTPSSAESPTVTYKVRDNDGDEASQTFTFTVEADSQPSQPSIADMHLKVGSSLWAELPAGTNGNPPFTYTISALPSGLNFDRATRILSGRPSSAGSTSVTFTVIDVDKDLAAEDFTIVVYALPDLPAISGQSGMKDELFTLQLPAATGGRAPLSYAATGLPSELSFIENTRVISGTPAQVEVINVNYTVTDRDNDQDSVTFEITVTDLDQSQIGNNDDNDNDNDKKDNNGGSQGGTNPQNTQPLTVVDIIGYTATVDELFTQQLPFASGGTLPYAYSVTTLPPGLDFTMLKRTITGTPSVSGTTVVTYTVTDSRSVSASDAFTITVSGSNQGSSNQGRGNQGGNNYGGSNYGGSNYGGSNHGGNNQGGSNQGGNNQGRKGGVGQGGGSQGGGSSNTKKKSGNSGNTNNQKKYTPPASSPPSSQQQYWSSSPVPVAVTLPSWLNVRRGPGFDYVTVATVSEGTRGNIYGRNPADNWFQVQIPEISNMVWVCQNLTRVDGSLDSVRFLEQWEIDLIPKQTDGPLATTTPAILNVRAGPGLDYEILTTLPRGTHATIVGLGPNAEWFMVTLDALTRPAWVYAALTTVEGSLGGVKQFSSTELDGYTHTEVDENDTCTLNPIAITTPAVLNVRRGPGTEYGIITTVTKGTRAEIIGIDPQDEWLLVELDKLVEPAWIYRDLTTVVGSLAGVRRINYGQVSQPNAPTNVDRPVAVTYPALANVRVGPGLTYGILKAVPQGTRARILGLSPDENWYLVEFDGMSQLGWIREDLTVLVGNLNSVKHITAAEIAMLPVAIVDTPILNVRSGPGTGFGIVTTISQGTWAQIIGVNPGADWFQVELFGVTGQTWVYRNLTNLAGLLAGVTQISPSTLSAETEDDPALQATTILESASTVAASTRQITVDSITVEISLPSNGNIDLVVSWTDAGACTELYNIYYRSSAASTTYFSLETAVIASSAQSKSLSFLTLPDNSLISAWCGEQSSGRQIAEVQIDAGVEGTYSSLPSQPEADAVAAASGVELSN